MADNEYELQKALLRKRTILIDGEVNSRMLDYVQTALGFLHADDSPPVQVIFSSPGGSVEIGLNIYDIIRLYPGEKNGIVITEASSMAAVILQACTTRSCARHAGVLIHHIYKNNFGLDTLRSRSELKKRVAHMERLQQSIYTILSERTRRPTKEIRRECKLNRKMTAQEALDFGLIDTVL
jgi:ATP-dependent Clp protease, protease subunit